MITKDQLISIGYRSTYGTTYTEPGVWEHEFNIKTQELFAINDGFGDPVFLCIVTDFEKLKELLHLLER